jgi:glyoxylase-like metal-dependent hydrolase (beta-lactamase superfamily II)
MPSEPTLPVADAWFRATPVDPNVTLITEPHVRALLRANTWHVRGQDRDLLVDSGLGVASLRAAFPDLFRREPVVVITHGHLDHAGSAHEFGQVWAHPLEHLQRPGPLRGDVLTTEIGLQHYTADEPLPPLLITALPHAGYDPGSYRLRPVEVTRHLLDGDTVDLGDRTFAVLHVPGHSPGGIALFDRHDGTLFAGDTLYDDVLLDRIDGADRADYRRSLLRLRELPVTVVHAGHEGSFDRARMHAIIDDYLDTG